MKLGVFDSGIGGEAIAASLRDAFPQAEIITVNDRSHLPYGDKSQSDIIRLTDTALQPLLHSDCDIIIIACNTATAAAIEWLRESYPNQTFIGLEPMIKPATELTKTGTIAICATPATLASDRYKTLKATFAQDITCLELNCQTWAALIEQNNLSEEVIEQTITAAFDKNADVVVLACTHYHWIREIIERFAKDRAVIIDPTAAIIERVRYLTQAAAQQQ